ncbi:hypothetical protein QYS46_01280 [Klebsiella michiganensis]|nr:hypothetical protein [Klebsiella michiganensis]
MKTNLAYASNCSDSVYSYIYQALQQRSGAENESLYQQAISSCCTDKQKKKLVPGIMPVHGSCYSTRGVTIASLTQRCWPFYSSSAYLISSAKK